MSRRSLVVALALVLAALPQGAAAEPGAARDERVELGRFSTTYATDAEHKPRASNVEIAAEAIDGKLLAPNAVLSFNEAVGERTAAFGFAKSVVIRNGMLAEGMGGGTCQVASTLHAAALLAGLEVVTRAPHSRPSGYIRMGLDATVAYPSIDLKLRNPLPSSVIVHARARRGSLDISIDTSGGAKPAVSLSSEIIERLPFERVVERDRTVHDENVHVKAFGIPGYRVRRVREVRDAAGQVRRDVRIDLYPPTSFVVRIAPSFEESRIDEGAPRVVDPGAVPPVLVQLRPSTSVALDNGAKAGRAELTSDEP